MTRLFVGSFLSAGEAAVFKRVDPKFKTSPLAKLHITWLFLGELKGENVNLAIAKFAKLRKAMDERRLCPFEIVYDTLEIWPSKGRPHVGVFTPQEPPKEVDEVAALVRLHLGDLQVEKEGRPFRPHLTAIRFKDGKPAGKSMTPSLVSVENELLSLLPISQTINTIDLIESVEGYRSLDSIRLISN